MEKLITNRKIFFIGIAFILIVASTYILFQNSNKEDEKLFDIFLANLYNEENLNIDDKLFYLSNLDKANISFFSDLQLASIKNLDRYDKIDKDIILLKKAIIDLDVDLIKTLSLDDSFTFIDIAKIYLYNLDINNFDSSKINQDNLNNFFIKAVNRLSNENN